MMGSEEAMLIFNEEIYAIKSRVLVIIAAPWETLKEEEHMLLSKILASVKLSLAAVTVIHLTRFRLDDITSYNPDYIVSFGAQYEDNVNAYEVVTTGKCHILQVDRLEHLDDTKKKRLWGALRQMFGI